MTERERKPAAHDFLLNEIRFISLNIESLSNSPRDLAQCHFFAAAIDGLLYTLMSINIPKRELKKVVAELQDVSPLVWRKTIMSYAVNELMNDY